MKIHNVINILPAKKLKLKFTQKQWIWYYENVIHNIQKNIIPTTNICKYYYIFLKRHITQSKNILNSQWEFRKQIFLIWCSILSENSFVKLLLMLVFCLYVLFTFYFFLHVLWWLYFPGAFKIRGFSSTAQRMVNIWIGRIPNKIIFNVSLLINRMINIIFLTEWLLIVYWPWYNVTDERYYYSI